MEFFLSKEKEDPGRPNARGIRFSYSFELRNSKIIKEAFKKIDQPA